MKRTSSLLFTLLVFTISSISQTTWEVGNTTLTEYDLVTGVQIPWEILWGPDDHIWMTSRKGEVMRIEPETGNYNVVLERNVISNGSGEPGMLSMAMHPDWENYQKCMWFIAREVHSMEMNISAFSIGMVLHWSTKKFC